MKLQHTKRGVIQDEKILEKVTKMFEKYKVDVNKAIRLLPYIDYVVKNGGRYDLAKMSPEEVRILDGLASDGYIWDIDEHIFVTREFYDFVCEVLWESYVEKAVACETAGD